MSLIAVERLSVTIGETSILEEVSLDIGPGEVLALIGESGSGKSMTALAMMGLLPDSATSEGSVRFEGRELLGLRDRDYARLRGDRIGMVFQEPMTALNPLKTIGAQVAESFLIHRAVGQRQAADAARGVLDRVGLSAIPAERYPHELSGGQRQRVVIAMAIALKPRLLIADEPTTALDVTTQAQILELLAGLVAADGMGLMFISHDLAVVAGIADRIAVMRAGRIVETGPAQQVLTQPAHAYTRGLLAASMHTPSREVHVIKGKPLLAVSEVSRAYVLPRPRPFARRPLFQAVDEVSFEVFPGESVGLVGESGSGKSTLARAVLGLEPVSGEIRLDDETINAGRKTPGATRAKLQAVFQDPYGSFDPRHRVDRLVAEPLHLMGAAAPRGQALRELVDSALVDVGLVPDDADKYIHEFSGGQRQRIAIARALILKPPLIVLDEAVSALDVSIRAQILDLLATLSARHGIAYLFISHDLGVVRAVTDRVLVMQAGRIVEDGRTDEVFAAPRHPYTQALLAATPRLEVALARRAFTATTDIAGPQ